MGFKVNIKKKSAKYTVEIVSPDGAYSEVKASSIDAFEYLAKSRDFVRVSYKG